MIKIVKPQISVWILHVGSRYMTISIKILKRFALNENFPFPLKTNAQKAVPCIKPINSLDHAMYHFSNIELDKPMIDNSSLF